MEDENKLPLVKESMKILVKNMRKQDRISIVVYAGAAGLVLEPTSGDKKDAILAAIDNLEAGGSTAGGEGIELAYATAKSAFMPKGNNRVILATDGDFNVGASSDAAMVRLIEEKRKTGIFLTVLGFGMGNYKDSKMQKLADSGNGNYAYVDSLSEAKKVLEKQMAGTLFTLAKDVKIQIEFNPATVAQYRLIGYEKRLLAAQDFDDDAKDAGELGAGHTVTALYEIVASDGRKESRTDLRYQQTTATPAADSGDLMTIKFRYKKPDNQTSLLLETPVPWSVTDRADADFRFAAAVAEWGLLLRNSEHKGNASYAKVLDLASGAITVSNDAEGYRKAFLGLVEKARSLTKD
jgi:Ca-activated chloride channel family protein